MARRTAKPKGPTKVENIRHDDKRVNIPTADLSELAAPGVAKAAIARDPAQDPQLIWRGKYPDDVPAEGDLIADAPPIYIQEKIDPLALVENLRRTAAAPADEPELALFEDYDGLDELDAIDFYRHGANWSNRMILGDSLQVMSSLAERESLRGKVQMIYIDPPYGIKFDSNWQASTKSRKVKDGKLEDAAREAEQIKAFRDTWELGIHSYLSYLRDRLLAARELLTSSGSCFVQIGTANLHLVTGLMAEAFGPENHIETIAFRKKTMPLGGRLLEGAYDYIVWFARDKELVKYRRLFQKQDVQGDTHWNVAVAADGTTRPMTRPEIDSHRLLPPDTDVAQLIGLYPVGPFDTGIYDYEFQGRTFRLPPGKSWPSPRTGMDRLAYAGRLTPYDDGNTLRYLLRHSDYPVTVYNNVWSDTSAATGMSYVVETSPKVTQRCMLMCTDPGDLVLDPTCGSGTTAYVAEQWGRRWITIDTSRVALALARQRLMVARFPYYLLADSEAGRKKEAEVSQRPLPPAQTSNDIRHGFVYQRVQHITLKSIANNPDIKKGMTREQIDAAIKKHADFELLYDKPYEDQKTVRVAGRFSVESLSPHRTQDLGADEDGLSAKESISEQAAARDPNTPSFEQTIFDNLQKAGIQNGRKAERMMFSNITATGTQGYISAVGHRLPSDDDEDDAPVPVALSIGPQYGTVDAKFIKNAVLEASTLDVDMMLDLVCVLGFAFDPQATGATTEDGVTIEASNLGIVAAERDIGRMKVLMVRMNADLLMGEDLKKTGAGNLFTVFGAPDIDIEPVDSADIDGQAVVAHLRGVDVYDPNTDEIRPSGVDNIALWMIDTDYNEESFFVRHCYFTGGNDPYKRLKTALKADIDPDAWDSLYRTSSRPFSKPTSRPDGSPGKIAVKVINDYGDEVMKVIEVP